MATSSTRTTKSAKKPAAATAKKTASAKTAKTTTAKKPTTAKSAASKPAASKPASKPAAAKKATPRAAAAKPAAALSLTPEQRYRMVQEAAYFLAEKNGFAGRSEDYWTAAEAQIDAMLARRKTGTLH